MSPRPRTQQLVKCDFCSKEVWKKQSELRLYKHHFCNNECHYKFSRRQRIRRECEWCGKEVIRYPSAIKNRVFCSRSCSTSARNTLRRGAAHPNWRGGLGSFRVRALRHYGAYCHNEPCEIRLAGITTPKEMLDVHHLDGNRANNALANLKVLCVWCHYKLERGKV